MKTVWAKHPWIASGAFLSLFALCSIAVHPFGAPKQIDFSKHPASELKLPSQIAAVFSRSCMDCHSNQAGWPWYSYVAPMSWMIERDVRGGRNRLNVSEWQQYTLKQQEKLLADIASAVKNREMPLPQYTLIHRGAKLSDAETDLVYAWARVERRKLKAGFPVIPASAGQRAGQ
ncbi:MAG: heme-binding domain-containing protein [Bryobacteraceae bacterium]